MTTINHKTKKPEKRVVYWGKYAGTKFADVPTEYLQWFVRNSFSQMANRRQWSIQELERRGEHVPEHKKPHTLNKPTRF